MTVRTPMRPTRIRQSLFPASLFGIYFIVLLLMSGIHTGLTVLSGEMRWGKLVQTVIPILYWAGVAAALTLFTRRQIRRAYEEPLHRMADATAKVAAGDFSVYVPPIHTNDNLDYLDGMILDFNKMVEELGSIETLKTDFVSHVSHEMKTPVAIIRNEARLLQSPGLTEQERHSCIREIEGAAVRLADLVTNVLKLSKLENQGIVPESRLFDLDAQLVECVLQFEDQWESRGIEVQTDLEESILVRGDPGMLELVWNNLLSNAFKFTESGGTVSVGAWLKDDKVRVEVEDTGCGMTSEQVRHAFDKFYQGDTSHKTEGNGLGLALAGRVLELENGQIEVRSEPGKGSCFTVILPAGDDDAGAV